MHEPITPLYLTSDIRRLEQTEAGGSLMAKAGQALATLAMEIAESDDPILIIAGPGNNGGDALVAARHLKQHWQQVIVVLVGDPKKLPADAAQAYQAWLAVGGSCRDAIPENTRFSLAIDGLFGIGLQRPLEGRFAELVKQINQL
ncbi:MAG TPA: NAD(P)H-hydrate epimerase, partial [Methylophilaceae bacterium]|nr:NAD(P)H-hydrate epimerase [Methylophilaceae bacterium]